MLRNLKVLGLAVVAVFALTAVAAQAASAAEFHSEVEPVIYTGAQSTANIFETNTGAKTECSTATFEGTGSTSPASSAKAHPNYGSCTFLSKAATVRTNGCYYTLNSATTSEKGKVEMTCEKEPNSMPELIEIDVLEGACTLSISPAQVNAAGGGVHYTNGGTGSERTITVEANVTGIAFTKTAHVTGGCTGAGSTATYTGNVLVKGYVDNGNSGTAGTPSLSMGAQKGIWFE